MKTFGEILKEKRIEKKITVEKLAYKLGVSQSIIYLWQNNEYFPNIMVACDLADIFECSLDELCGREVKINE